MPARTPFYARGLRFSCARCSECCRIDPGFVFLRERDVESLASALGMGRAEFVGAHCRWVPVLGGGDQLSLRERANYDCVFWKDGCSVYEARPLQCRTYPFWPSLLESRRAWDAMGCPGMGKGELHSREEIERAMALLREEPVIQRAGGDGA